MKKMNGMILSETVDKDGGFAKIENTAALNRALDRFLQGRGRMSASEIAFRERVKRGHANRKKKDQS